MAAYESFLRQALAAGYDQPAVEAEIRKALPQIFLLAKQKGIPDTKVRSVLTRFGMPENIWKDPATIKPAQTPAAPIAGPTGLPTINEQVARAYVPTDPTRKGPADPKMTEVFQAISKMLTMPGRGIRGGMVGAAGLATGQGGLAERLGPASERAAEATKTGFVPQGTLEGIAAVVGPMVGDATLTAGLAAPAGAMARAGIAAGGRVAGTAAPAILARLTAAGVEGATAGGAFSALQQMAEKGTISKADFEEAVKLGAAMGPVIQLGAEGAQAAAALWRRIAPAVKVRIQYELNDLAYRIKRASGGQVDLGVETGLVPYDVKQAVAEGRMSLAEAARQSSTIFEEQLKVRGLKTPAKAPETAPPPSEPSAPVSAPPGAAAAPARTGKRASRKAPKTPPIADPAFQPPPPGPQVVGTPSPLAPPARTGPLEVPKALPPELAPPPKPEKAITPAPDATEVIKPGGMPTTTQHQGGRWSSGPEAAAAIPGEPMDYLDLPKDGDPEKATAALIETDDGDYQVILSGGKPLKNPDAKKPSERFNFPTAETARAAAEKAVPLGTPAAPKEGPVIEAEAPGEALPAPVTPREGSAYENDDLPTLMTATRSEQTGRWQAIQDLEKVLAEGKLKGKKLQKVKANVSRLRQEYEATWSEVMDAAGEETAQIMRREIEGALGEPAPEAVPVEATGPTEAPISAASETPRTPGTDRPAPAATPLQPGMTAEIISKARKQAALEQIDQALKDLAAGKKVGTVGNLEKAQGKGADRYIEVKVNGGIKVAATKDALTDLRTRIKQLPEKALLGRQKYPLQGLTYTAARQERFNPLYKIEGKTNWFTDGLAAIKGAPPAKVDMTGKTLPAKQIEDIVKDENAGAKPAKLLYYFVDESFTTGVSPIPIDKRVGNQPPNAVFQTSEGKFVYANQLYVTAVVNRHSDAAWHVNQKGVIVARVGAEPVGVIMPLKDKPGDPTVILDKPPLAGEAELAGLYSPKDVPPPAVGGNLASMEPLLGQPAPGGLGKDLFTAADWTPPASDPPIKDANDRRLAFANSALSRVDRVRARQVLLDLKTKIGIPETVTFKEKQGGLKGFVNTVSHEAMIGNRDNIATFTHEMTHAILLAMGGEQMVDDNPVGLTRAVGLGPDAALEKAMRDELKGLSQLVRPYYPQGGDFENDKHWKLYRETHHELIADWGSAFMIDPALARAAAPTFTNLWVKNLQRFPRVKQALEPFLGDKSPLLKMTFQDRSPEEIGKELVDWVKGVELDPQVKDYTRSYAQMGKDALTSLYYLIGTPFSKGQLDPRMGRMFNAMQGMTYRVARLETTGLDAIAKIADLRALPTFSQERISDLLFYGNDEPIQKYFTKEELATKATPEEIEAYQRVVRTIKFGTNMLAQVYRGLRGYDLMSPEQQREVDVEIFQTIEKLGGYFPLMRFGDHVVYGEAPDGDPEQFWYSFDESQDAARRTANDLSKAGYQNVQLREKVKLPPEFWERVGRSKMSGFELEQLIERSGVSRQDPVIQQLLAAAKTTSFRQMIHRKWIPGVHKNAENMLQSLEAYVSNMASRLAKFEAKRESEAALAKIDRNREPVLYADALRYSKTLQETTADQMSAIRQFIYHWNLSYKLAFFLQNLTQPLMTTWNEIARFEGGIGPERIFLDSYRKTFALLKRSFGKDAYDHTGLSPLEAYILRRLEKEGQVSGQFTQEMLAEKARGKFAVSKFFGFMGHQSEQINRLHAAFSALEIARRLNLPKDKTYAFVMNFIHRTQFPFGQANYPAWMQGASWWKSVARLLYLFRGYPTMMTERLWRQTVGNERQFRVAARSWAALLGLAGASGAPFEAMLRWAIWKFTGHDIDTDIRKLAGDKEWVADLAIGGLPALADIDTRRMLGLGDIYQAPRVGSGFAESAAQFIGGAPMGMASKIGQAKDLFGRGEFGRGFEKLAPAALANLQKASRIAEEGLRHPSGELLIPKEKITAWKQAQTAMGFTPFTFSKEYDKREAARRVKFNMEAEKERYTELMAKAIHRCDFTERDRLRREIEASNVAARKAKQPEKLILITNQAVKNRIWKMRTEGLGPRIKHAPRQLRRSIRDLDILYGQ